MLRFSKFNQVDSSTESIHYEIGLPAKIGVFHASNLAKFWQLSEKIIFSELKIVEPEALIDFC